MERTLKVTERAYLNIGLITLDPNDGVIILPVENSGKLPATDANIFGCVLRMHDKKELDVALITIGTRDSQIPPGKGYQSYSLKMRHWSPAELEVIKQKDETIFIGLTLRYGDGLGKVVNNYRYCTQTLYDTITKNINWTDCVPGTLDKLLARTHVEIEKRQKSQEPNAQPNSPPAFP